MLPQSTETVVSARVVALRRRRRAPPDLKATCNWSNHETSRWRSAAAAINAHPSIGDAWSQGRIGAPQVVVLAKTYGNRRVRDALPAFLPFLVTNAEELCFDDFTATVDHFVAKADVEGAHDERDDAIEHRRASVKPNGRALDMYMFGGDGVTTDEVIGIYETFCDAELHKDLATVAFACTRMTCCAPRLPVTSGGWCWIPAATSSTTAANNACSQAQHATPPDCSSDGASTPAATCPHAVRGRPQPGMG